MEQGSPVRQSCCWVLQLAAASSGAGPQCLRPVRSLRVQSLACPHLYLPRRCVLDATPPHRTPCWFPAFALGHNWFAPFGQGFPAPWWASRLRLEAVYTLLPPLQNRTLTKTISKLAQNLFKIGSKLVQNWLNIDSKSAQNRLKIGTKYCPIWFKIDSKILKIFLKLTNYAVKSVL